jgi:hypothetical protein
VYGEHENRVETGTATGFSASPADLRLQREMKQYSSHGDKTIRGFAAVDLVTDGD